MKLKTFILGLVVFFTWIPSVQAYPWMFFRESELPEIVEWDIHASYFVKGKATVFSGIKLDYHNPKVDINLGYNYSFLERRHYFRVSELAVIFPFIFEKWKVNLGFKDVLWSEADRYWNYGLWQPRYLLDAFRPVQMGLPGLYLNHEGDTSVLFLLSYFYLPDIIIYPRLKEGHITSENPFFVESFKGFRWNLGKKLELFQLNRFFRPIVAFQIKHFIEDSNFSLSYAYKPVNQFQYSIAPQGINSSDKKRGQLEVKDFKYFILSHHLTSLEGEISLVENVSLFASLFYEEPEKKAKEKGWISDGIESHLTFSFLAYFQENLAKESKTLFTLGYTKTMENHSDEYISNPLTEDLESIFSRAFMWKEALSISIEYQNKNLFQGFLSRFRANYALDNGYYAIALENYFYFTPYFRSYLSGDIIFHSSDVKINRAVKTNKVVENGTSFISKYDGLSRFLVGVQYVF